MSPRSSGGTWNGCRRRRTPRTLARSNQGWLGRRRACCFRYRTTRSGTWKCNLWNLFHFLSLRLDLHAQDEIRLYAAELAKLARTVAPVAYEAFEEFQLEAVSLTQRERVAVRALLEGAPPETACERAGLRLKKEDGTPMSSGEGVEFLEKLERLRTDSSPA